MEFLCENFQNNLRYRRYFLLLLACNRSIASCNRKQNGCLMNKTLIVPLLWLADGGVPCLARHAQNVPWQRAVPEQLRALSAEGPVQRAAGVWTPQPGCGILPGTEPYRYYKSSVGWISLVSCVSLAYLCLPNVCTIRPLSPLPCVPVLSPVAVITAYTSPVL